MVEQSRLFQNREKGTLALKGGPKMRELVPTRRIVRTLSQNPDRGQGGTRGEEGVTLRNGDYWRMESFLP